MVSPVAWARAGSQLRDLGPTRRPYLFFLPTSQPLDHHGSYYPLLTTCFLHLAFFTTHRPPLPDPLAPSLSPWDILAVTISHGKRAELPYAKPPLVEELEQTACNRYWVVLRFLLALSSRELLCPFVLFLFNYLQYTWPSFEKLVRYYLANLVMCVNK